MIARQNLFTAFVVACVLLTATCCKRNADRGGLSRVTIGTFSRAIDYSPYYVARHFKWFEDSPKLHGIAIDYREFNDRPTISSALDRGDLSAVFAAEPPIIICRAQNNDIRIVELSCTLQQEIVVRAELAVRSVADLHGKKVAVLQGTSSHYGLIKILRTAGLSPSDVEIIFMGPDQAKVAFETRQIDAWAVWPPFVEQQQVSGRGNVLTGGDAVIQSVMAVPMSVIRNNTQVAEGLVAAIQQAKQWIQANPAEAQSIVSKELGLEIEVVKTAWAKHNWAARLTDDVIDDIQNKAQFLAAEGATRLNKAVNVKRELIDLQFYGAK